MPSRFVSTVAFACRLSDESISRVASNHVLHRHPFTPFDEAPPAEAASFSAMPIPEQILPQLVGDNFRHRLGTFPVEISNWLLRDAEFDLTVQLKKKLLATRRSEVVGLQPGGDEVAEEAAQLVSAWAGVELASRGIDALVEASLLVADDLAVLQPIKSHDGSEQLLLNAAVVCCPSRWMLSEKMGHNMLAIHEPVAKYADHVGAAVDTYFQRLTVEKPVWRSNWIIQDHPALFQPQIPTGSLVKTPDELWIRMERQTLRRLPKTGGILFTIRGYQQPLPEYLSRSKQIAQNIRTMLERLPDDVAQYKSVLKYRPAIMNWINQFC
ncbi:MAG: heme-dependent oxidative N-demethylase family protein [Ilumatobacteraceae bacterium]